MKFKEPSHATDSELTDEDMIIRYAGNKVVGLTVFLASAETIGTLAYAAPGLESPL